MRTFILLFIVFFILSCNNKRMTDKPTIISLIKENNTENFNSLEKGFLDQLSLLNLNVQINYYNSDGDDTTTINIANIVRDDNSSIAIVLGEKAALLSRNIIVPQSIIFAGCFDIISLSSIEESRIQNDNIIGVYATLHITNYLDKISINPIKSLGYLYLEDSKLSSHISKDLLSYCDSANIDYYPLAISDNFTIEDIEKLIFLNKINYLYIANEDYINDNIYDIVFVCDKYHIPIINTDMELALNSNILFSLGFNYYCLGRELAFILKDVIYNNGSTKDLKFIKVEDHYRILVNEDVAKSYHISLKEEILNDSYIIIKNGNIIRQ